MKRRQFIAGSSAIAAAILLSRCTSPSSRSAAPETLRSQNGLLDCELTSELMTVSLADRKAQLMAYNGQVPGPRLEANPGDTVRIRFHNRLQEPTNLHFHGLHIPPTGKGDDPFRQVEPGATADYEFTIPTDHPGGLFWYHPHFHGLVAKQVFHGLAGAFVIRGKEDNLPEFQAAQEAILVLQDFDLDRRGRVQEPQPVFRMWGREGNLVTVNGQTRQDFDLPQGGLLRLRILNASVSRIYQLRLQDHPWYLAATDGIALTAPVERHEVVLAPGERADLLIPGAQQPGRYPLLSLPYDRGITTMAQDMGITDIPIATVPVELGEVAYQTGQNQTGQNSVGLPASLTPVVRLPEPDTVREFVLDHGIDPETQDPFLINGRAFNHHRTDHQVQLGTVEDWVITNNAGMDHPFHIHTNAFQIISRNGQPEPLPAWKDVVNIPAYETVRIRIPFRDFAGKTVYHCHILDHEDQGMMGIVEMV
jgi:FtsP/CotA-like multicopper oxidase with cupredoxin domain